MISYEEYVKLRETPLCFDEQSERYLIGNKIISRELGKALIDRFHFNDVGEVIDRIKNDFTTFSFDLSSTEKIKLLTTLLSLIENKKISWYSNDSIFDLKKSIFSDIEIIESYKTLFDRLKKVGFAALYEIDASDFTEGSESMKNISMNVEEYLNYLAQKIVKTSNPNFDYKCAEKEIDKLMAEYKTIVENKRQTRASFISKMSEKISGIKKYHHAPTTHQEGHDHNPFANDIRSL